MLIESTRFKIGDRETWRSLERYDAKLARSARLESLTYQAIDIIRAFAGQGACYCSTSWGKDSTVLVDLVGKSGLDIPVVFMGVDGYEQEGVHEVRDMMLKLHPHLDYSELVLPPQPNRWWDTERQPQSKYDADLGWRLIAKRYGPRRMTGIRAEESRLRTMVLHRFGDASANACRPIGRWTAVDVFAYLYKHVLPVHPTYAMSHGGKLDRRWLRVHNLGGVTGSDRGRADWETAYYGDIIAASRKRDVVAKMSPEWPPAPKWIELECAS